ncbi:hypothetical protein BJ165DRAFT_1524487 [Panaeolus papilionaceus]|nr:hypothetical protein BJ165DRAFT_1524487 [Panaeolus papilionaceus]
MIHRHFLWIVWFFLLVSVSHSQEAPSEPVAPIDCTFSCPPTDLQGGVLVKRPNAIGFNSHYSIFECVYLLKSAEPTPTEHTCSYWKEYGEQILGSIGDNCSPKAVPCPNLAEGQHIDTANPPLFSHQEKAEVLPWFDSIRYPLWLKEHHRG